MNIEERKIRTAQFRKTQQWQHLRSEAIQRSDGQCECSGGYENGGERGSSLCENAVKHIHHLVYPIKPATITVDELMGLCQVCHETRHEVNSVLETLPCCRYVHRRYYYPCENTPQRLSDDAPVCEPTLIELARRGYNVTNRRTDETTAEIVKIG